MVIFNSVNGNENLRIMKKELSSLKNELYFNHYNRIFQELLDSLENKDKSAIQDIMNYLFFTLFNLDEKEIDYLLKKYYES